MSGEWEDCPCCGAATFPDGSTQWDGAPVPCGCDCWVSLEYECDIDEHVGYICMGDGPCPACSVRAIWLDGPDSEAARAARAAREPDPSHTPAVRRVVAWELEDGSLEHDPVTAYRRAARERMENSPGFHRRQCAIRDTRERLNRWRRVIAHLAAYLRHRDEKAGYW